MTYGVTAAKLAAWREQIAELRQMIRQAQADVEPEPVQDYEFATVRGAVRLSQLFGDKRDLFVIHNMGCACVSCTLWADGFNGIYPHIADRAAFVIASPDPPGLQRDFATSRGWRFPMVSHQGSSCGSPTPASSRATTSARSGACSICYLKVPTAGSRNSPTADYATPVSPWAMSDAKRACA